MECGPRVETARVVEQFEDGSYRAELLTGVAASGPIDYEHLLVVRDGATGSPVCIVSAEVNRAHSDACSGSHVLGLFPGDGHAYLGASDGWADLDAFRERALSVAAEQLGLADSWRVVATEDHAREHLDADS